MNINSQLVLLTVSLGAVSADPSESSTPESVLRAANAALYRAKQRGPNCVEFLAEEISAAARHAEARECSEQPTAGMP